MDPRNPPPKGDSKPKPPKWSSPLWYLPIMILLLWFWQSTVSQFSYRTIPYSEFKSYLANHEVVRCVIRDDDIQGEIQPKVAEARPLTAFSGHQRGYQGQSSGRRTQADPVSNCSRR